MAVGPGKQHQQLSLQNGQSDNEEYMDLDEFFTALQDYNSITPFGKSKRGENCSKMKSSKMFKLKNNNHINVIRSQLKNGKANHSNYQLDNCPCNGRKMIASEKETVYRKFLCDSILVNHLMTLLPSSTGLQQNRSRTQHQEHFQKTKVITLESS